MGDDGQTVWLDKGTSLSVHRKRINYCVHLCSGLKPLINTRRKLVCCNFQATEWAPGHSIQKKRNQISSTMSKDLGVWQTPVENTRPKSFGVWCQREISTKASQSSPPKRTNSTRRGRAPGRPLAPLLCAVVPLWHSNFVRVQARVFLDLSLDGLWAVKQTPLLHHNSGTCVSVSTPRSPMPGARSSVHLKASWRNRMFHSSVLKDVP